MTQHSDDQIERAAARFEVLADQLDPETVEAERLDDLRGIAEAAESLRADEARLRRQVETARGHGRSWNEIARALGVSRQAARQRFTKQSA